MARIKRHKGYIWEKLSLAVTSMAVDPDPLRKRLCTTWATQLHILHPEDFDDHHPDLTHIFVELKSVLDNKDSINNLDNMTDDDVYVLAKKITDLYDQVCARRL